MRVLLASWAWPSHYFPLVPLGWAARAAGHEVVVASQAALIPTITDSGLPAVEVGKNLDFRALMYKPMRGVTAASSSREFWRELVATKATEAISTFITLAETMLNDLLAFVHDWRPHLIVHDTTTYAAPMVAAMLGIPAVRHTWGPDLMCRFPRLDELLSPMLERHGLTAAALAAATTLDPCPPSMQVESRLHRTWMRYIPYNGPARVPGWSWRDGGRKPRVCVTCGTTSGKLGGEGQSLPARITQALEGVKADVLLAISPEDKAALAPLPGHIRAEVMLPLHVVLPQCDLLIQRGGGATTMTALAYGVPQLVVPFLPDHAFNSRQFAKTGAGIALLDGDATNESLRAAIRDLLTKQSYRANAAKVQAEMAAQPSVEEAVGALEQYVHPASHRASRRRRAVTEKVDG